MKLFAHASAPATSGDWLDTESWVRFGMRVVVWMFGGLIAFLALVSINGAVVAPGSVTVEGNYKTVQHLDGGIVSKILVKNGDRVKAGDVLVLLDDTQARATLAVTNSRLQDFLIQRTRLEAERGGKADYQLPAEVDPSNPDISKIVEAQKSLFDARRTSQFGQQSMLNERLTQLQGETQGLNAQLAATKKQRTINEKELASVQPLFDKGFVNQQRIAPLQRESARLEGETGRLMAELSKINSALAETELRAAQVDKEYLSQVADDLKTVEGRLAEQFETQKALADTLARTEVRSPVNGFVHGLTVHTEGGVITPASPLLQIVPDGARLIVEAQLQTQDIDKVHETQTASVNFPAFNASLTPRLQGQVKSVSPAQLTDKDGRSYFSAIVEISPEEIARIGKGHALVPGMPAEVFIETSSRSILSYLMKPLANALARTFREN